MPTTIEELQLQIAEARQSYRVAVAAYEEERERSERAMLAMEERWCRLVWLRFQLARAQGVDPMSVCFEEPQ